MYINHSTNHKTIVNTGNITVGFHALHEKTNISIDDQFKPFIIHDTIPDIELCVNAVESLPVPEEPCVFRDTLWTLYYLNSSASIVYHWPDQNAEPYALSYSKNNFSKWNFLFISDHPYLSKQTEIVKINNDCLTVNPYKPLFVVVPSLLRQNHRNTIIIHASGVDDGKNVYIFPGISGVGKTTISKLWKKRGAKILSDETIVIRQKGTEFYVYGTPWTNNDERYYLPSGKKLTAILFPYHSQKNNINSLTTIDTLKKLFQTSYTPRWNKKNMESILDLFIDIANTIPCVNLGFVPDNTVISTIRQFSSQ